jgi:spermidine/putrescine-binding protein
MKTSLKRITLAATALAAFSLTSCAEMNQLLGYNQGSRWYRDRFYTKSWADVDTNPRVADKRFPNQGVIYTYGVPQVRKNAGSMRGANHYSAPIYSH